MVVAASSGTAPAPQLVLRALGAGAVPVASRLPRYEESLDDGELGLLFEPRDALTLAAQLDRLTADPELLGRLRGRVEDMRRVARVVAHRRRLRGPLRRASSGAATTPTATPGCASGCASGS